MKTFASAIFVTSLALSSLAMALPLTDIPSLIDRKNGEVAAARKDVDGATDGAAVAWARHLPSIHWRNTYVHLGNDIQLQLPAQSLNLGALGNYALALPPITIQKQDIYLSALTASFPIFAGGRINAGIDAAYAQKDEARATLKKTSQEKTQEAVARYFGAQLARRVNTILDDMAANLDRMRAISESMLKTGLGTRFAVLQIKVAQADLASRREEAKGKVQLADLAFKTTTGIPAAEEVAYETPFKKVQLPGTLDDLKAAALTKRSEFEVLSAKAKQADALRRVHVGEMLPTVALVGTKQLTTTTLPVIQPPWAVGILIDVPLTNWISGMAERERVVKMEEKVEILRAHAKEQVPLEVEKLYREAVSTQAAFAATEEGLGLAQEALRLAEVRFKSGGGSAVELLRATTDLEKAEINNLRLLVEFNEKVLDLCRAAGDVNRFLDFYRVEKEGT
jgi:outer membrane protein TolC